MTLKNKFLTTFCAVLLLLVMLASCKRENKVEGQIPATEEKMALSGNDTTKVMDLMHQYFDLLLKKDYDGAMSMIYQLRNDSLLDADPEVEEHYQMGMKLITPIRYEIETMIFETERDCLVKYAAVLFEKEGEGDNRPNKMIYTVKPVRVNGEWYLTVSDKNDMNTRDSQIVQ